MRKTRNALLGILTMMSGAILAVPTEAAERYIPGVHLYKAVPERYFSFPYGGSYLKRAKRAFGNPYVNPYYGTPSTTMEIIALPTIGDAGANFSLGPLARLAQNEELGCTCGEARGGRGLGQMTRASFASV